MRKPVYLSFQEYSHFTVPRLAARLKRLPRRSRSRLTAKAARFLSNPKLVANEAARVGAARLLVAALPHTLGTVEALLGDFSRPMAYEVHFSLFCFLDRDSLPRAPWVEAKVLPMLERYLRQVPRQTAYAAWMAGDALGDHWQTNEALDVLLRSVVGARYAAGRKAAIHGLEHALHWVPPSSATKVWSTLRGIALSDHSQQVRDDAKSALEGRGCGPPAPLRERLRPARR